MRNIDSLKKKDEFDRVFRGRDSKADRFLVVYKAEGSGRIGIVCSKKVGNSVVRHRTVRLIREAYRLNKEKIRKDADIIVVARETAKGQGFIDIENSLVKLLTRHSLM